MSRNQAEVADALERSGWISYMHDNSHGWKFYFKRDPDPENYHEFFGWGWLYLTVFPNGHTAEGIIETRYQREKRKARGILFRDFRGLKF